MEDIKKWVKDKHNVKVLAMSSYEASMVLSSSGLSPEGLFEPFTEISNPFSVKSLSKTLNCSNFKIKVFEKIELKRNDQLLNSLGPKINWQQKWEVTSQSLSKLHSNDPTPWFNVWKEDYFKSQLFSQHELIDMPLCIIYLASTTDSDPLQTFQTLARPQGLPPIYQSRTYDSKVPKVFLLVHDPSKSQLAGSQLDKLVEKLQKALSPSLFYLQSINSGNSQNSLLWDNKAAFNQEESSKLQMMMNEIVIRAIVPYIEGALKSLDLILEQKKRGLKNSLSKFFTKKERPEAFSFQVDSIEHVCRLLADLAFIIGDYEEALSHYKSVSNDLKNLKAWSHMASVHEMMALCGIMTGADVKEIENLLDQAYGFYQKSGDQSLIARCLLYHRQVFFRPEFCKKLAVKLLSGCTDSKDIRYIIPLFTEQAAFCYLLCNPSYSRKFAFYLVIAGDEYRKLELVHYALNSYYLASQAFSGKKWEHIEMHVQHMMGRFCYFLNMQIESVHFYLSLVASPKLLQHKDQHQKKILNEMMATVAQWSAMPIPAEFNPITKETVKFHSDGKPILDFNLPKIVKYEISLPQDRVLSVNEGNLGDFVLWKNLLPKEFSGFAEIFKKFDGESLRNLEKGLYCGETIEISVNCLNVMSFANVFECVSVIVEHEDGECTQTNALETLDLEANQEKRVVFRYQQDKPGKIQVKYLRWSFGKVFYGNFMFKSDCFQVSPAVSGISVEVVKCPEYLLEGEIAEIVLLVTNQDLNKVEDLLLTFSHSYLFGKSSLNIGTLSASEQQKVILKTRGEKLGTHLFRLLATYKSSDQKRFLRFQHSLEIRPSVKIQTRLDYSLKSVNESILHLVARPALQSRLEIKKIVSLTNHNLRLIKNIANEVYYVAVQSLSPEPSSPLNKSEQLQTISFSDSIKNEDSTFIEDVKSSLSGQTSSGLDLIIHWELETDRLVTGFHYLLNLAVKDQTSPIRVTLTAPCDISHDFLSTTLCQVPVKLSVKNVSSETFESLSLTAVQDEEFKDFVWVGSTCRKVNHVAPGESADLELKASFFKTGSFDLNRFVIRINDSIADVSRPLQLILIR